MTVHPLIVSIPRTLDEALCADYVPQLAVSHAPIVRPPQAAGHLVRTARTQAGRPSGTIP